MNSPITSSQGRIFSLMALLVLILSCSHAALQWQGYKTSQQEDTQRLNSQVEIIAAAVMNDINAGKVQQADDWLHQQNVHKAYSFYVMQADPQSVDGSDKLILSVGDPTLINPRSSTMPDDVLVASTELAPYRMLLAQPLPPLWQQFTSSMILLIGGGLIAFALSHLLNRILNKELDALTFELTLALDRQQFHGTITPTGALQNLAMRINQLFSTIVDERQQLKESEQAISQLRYEVDTRIRERTDALQTAKQAAERANEAKSTFLATMSHEIRTPMNGIIGTIDLLRKTDLTTAQFRMTDTIRESSFSLLRILDDILDFSKIEAGKLELEMLPLSINDIVEAVGRILVSMALQRQIDLKLYVDPKIPDGLLGDPVRLRQILYNLAGNAIKFTETTPHKTGLVQLRAELIQENMEFCHIKITVSDNGKGMTERQSHHVFQPFNQGEGSITRKYGGTGLGLSICQRLTALMYGEIDVQSTVGVGTEFFVTLPMRRTDEIHKQPDDLLAHTSVALVSSDEINSKTLTSYLSYAGADIQHWSQLPTSEQLQPLKPQQKRLWLLDATYEQLSAEHIKLLLQHAETAQDKMVVLTNLPELPTPEDPRIYFLHASPICRSQIYDALQVSAGRKIPQGKDHDKITVAAAPTVSSARDQGQLILLAEDNLMNQRVIMEQLDALGYAVEVADDGAIALEMWRKYRYPLLLTDLHMPNMSGYDLAAAIRKESLQYDDESSRYTRIIAVTANALKGEEQKCLSVGMDGYITKPIELAVLDQVLQRWLPRPIADANNANTSNTDRLTQNSPICFTTIANFLGNNPRKHEEFLNYFVRHGAELLQQLNDAIDQQNWSQLQSVSHQLKSVAKSVGALALSEVAQRLELASERAESSQDFIDELTPLRTQLQQHYQAVVDYIQRRY